MGYVKQIVKKDYKRLKYKIWCDSYLFIWNDLQVELPYFAESSKLIDSNYNHLSKK